MPEENRFPARTIAVLFSVVSFFLFSWHLEQISLYHSDEQYYIQSCRNMLDSGDWLTPVLNEKKRFAKPILFYWPVSLSFKIFGTSLPSARFVSALMGALGLWIVYRMGSILYGPLTGLYSLFILASSYLYFLSARLAYTDMTLCFFITLSLYFFVVACWGDGQKREDELSDSFRKKNIFYFYLAAGLATATKGPPGLFIPGLIIISFFLLTRERSTAGLFFNPFGIIVFLFLSFFWPVSMAWVHGSEFIHHLIREEGVNRSLQMEIPGFYFFIAILRYFPPWSIFLLAAAFWAFRKGQRGLLRKEETRQLFLWLYLLVPLALFTIFSIRHSRYILPTAPAIAILLGCYFRRAASGEIPVERGGFKIGCYITLVLYSILSILTLAAGFLFYYLEWSIGTPYVFVMPFVFFLSVLLLRNYGWKKKDFTLLPVFIAFPLLVSFPLLAGKVIPSLKPEPAIIFAEKMGSQWKPGLRIATLGVGKQTQRLRVLTGRPVTALEPKNLGSFLETKGPVFLVIRENKYLLLPENVKNDFQIISEAKRWKKIKADKDFFRRARKGVVPELLEELKETLVLVYRAA